MSLTNPFGDQQITDPQVMRALAHPVRIAALTHLQIHGPATATMLAPHVGATPSVTSWHLRHLAGFGLVTDADHPGDRRHRWWQAVASGFSIASGDDPAAQAAGRALGHQMRVQAQQQVERWIAETEPRLDPPWRELAGLSNTSVVLTAAELADVTERIDELLAAYVRRDTTPPDGRRVRILRHYLPEQPS